MLHDAWRPTSSPVATCQGHQRHACTSITQTFSCKKPTLHAQLQVTYSTLEPTICLPRGQLVTADNALSAADDNHARELTLSPIKGCEEESLGVGKSKKRKEERGGEKEERNWTQRKELWLFMKEGERTFGLKRDSLAFFVEFSLYLEKEGKVFFSFKVFFICKKGEGRKVSDSHFRLWLPFEAPFFLYFWFIHLITSHLEEVVYSCLYHFFVKH